MEHLLSTEKFSTIKHKPIHTNPNQSTPIQSNPVDSTPIKHQASSIKHQASSITHQAAETVRNNQPKQPTNQLNDQNNDPGEAALPNQLRPLVSAQGLGPIFHVQFLSALLTSASTAKNSACG
jgi:hypothetical protein